MSIFFIYVLGYFLLVALLHSFYNENFLEYFLTHMREHLPFAGVLPCESSRAQMSRGPRQPGPFPAEFFP